MRTELKRAAELWGHLNGFMILHSDRASYIFLNPVEKIEDLKLLDTTLNGDESDNDVPVVAGYISYEHLHAIEDIPMPKADPFQIPSILFFRYSVVIEVPKDSVSKPTVHRPDLAKSKLPVWEVDIDQLFSEKTRMELTLPQTVAPPSLQDHLEQFSNFTRESYMETVSQIRNLILDGEVYQVNLSQLFELPYSSEPHLLYQSMGQKFPDARSAYLNFLSADSRETCQIVSVSPELFFKTDGSKLICSPIKGTRSRAQGSQAAEELKGSAKDLAELSMIVDLVRNDMGKVAEIGTVTVDQHARLKTLPHLYHLVSDVSCQIAADTLPSELINALFPCGSITGCPKIAAMKYISELERTTRGIYTGAIGYFTSSGAAEFSVAIRTALLKEQKLYFQGGGGVVIDSDPESEYYETLIKVQGFYDAWNQLEGGDKQG